MLVLKYCTGVIMYCTYYTLQQFHQTVILLKIRAYSDSASYRYWCRSQIEMKGVMTEIRSIVLTRNDRLRIEDYQFAFSARKQYDSIA